MTTLTNNNSYNNTRDVPRDEHLPGLPLLLDAAKIAEVLQNRSSFTAEIESCHIAYVRFKPATNCLAAYRIILKERNSESKQILLFGKCFTSEDYQSAEAKLSDKGVLDRDAGFKVILLPDSQIIIDSMLNDPHLEGLQTIFDSRKLRRILYDCHPSFPKSHWRISHKRQETEVVRYKPEKRAVVRFTTTATNLERGEKMKLTFYLRVYCDDRGAQIDSLTQRLGQISRLGKAIRIPRTFAYVPEKRLLVMEGLDGFSLLEALQKEKPEQYLVRTAALLAKLHSIKSVPLETRNVSDLLQDCLATCQSLSLVLPERKLEIDQLYEHLESRKTEPGLPFGLVHGDFHHGQVLIQSDGEALLDFDRSYVGDPLFDLGNFCAHLRVLQLEKRLTASHQLEDLFVRSYESATGDVVSRTALSFWTSVGLLLLAIHPFRTLEPDWRAKVSTILQKSREAL